MSTTPRTENQQAAAKKASAAKTKTKPAKPAKAVKAPKAAKPVKAIKLEAKKKVMPAGKKPKLVRDSYTLSRDEHAALAALKERSAALGHKAKKGELLRAGLQALSKLGDTALLQALNSLPALKPAKPGKPVKEAAAKPVKAKTQSGGQAETPAA